MSSRSRSAHSCAAAAGHSTLTVPPRRRTSMRIGPVAGIDGSGNGTKTSWLSIAKLGAVAWIAMGLPLRSACLTHRCSIAALSPRARGHRRNGYAWLLARAHRFRFKMCAVDSSTATANLDQLSARIHVNAYLL